jgi:hypothetical protein
VEIPGAPSPESSQLSTAAAPTYTDRGPLLIVFGVVQIILGALCLLFIPFMLLGPVIAARTGTPHAPLATLALSVSMYFALAVMFICLGIGSIQARRWARALTLITSWIGLISGILIIIVMTAILPTSFAAGMRSAAAQNPHGAGFTTGVAAVMLTFMIVFFAIFFIVIPLAFVIFYGRRDVAETCKHRDPIERWTDRCPLPVLGASVLFAAGAAYCLLFAVTTPMLPFFGKYVTGIPAGVAFVLIACFYFFLAWSIFRLKVLGWWLAVVALCLRIASAAITFWRGDLFQAVQTYTKLELPAQQMQMMRQNPFLRFMPWGSVAFSLIMLGYLVYLKRYFNQPQAHSEISSGAPPAPASAI